jgi:hypothetical protein
MYPKNRTTYQRPAPAPTRPKRALPNFRRRFSIVPTTNLTSFNNRTVMGIGNMADYYPLISKAVAGNASSESRQILYGRVREALLKELRTATPPFTEFQIMRERLALEDALRKVEEQVVDEVAGHGEPETTVATEDLNDTDFEDIRIGVNVPFMFVSGEVSGRFNPIWRIPSKTLRSTG